MRRKLKFPWRHLEEGRETCIRCSRTRETLHETIAKIKQELGLKGIEPSRRFSRL